MIDLLGLVRNSFSPAPLPSAKHLTDADDLLPRNPPLNACATEAECTAQLDEGDPPLRYKAVYMADRYVQGLGQFERGNKRHGI